MILLHEENEVRVESRWLNAEELERATGWRWKPEGLCRGDTCMPLPRGATWVERGRIDVIALWRHAGWPVAVDRREERCVLGEGASRRAAALQSLDAPDFELPDFEGRAHRLSDFRGQKVFLVTWASWCGCRGDLPLWSALAPHVTVIAVALDTAEAARPFAANAGCLCLVDREHRVAELYNLVNVPQAVWVDEAGRMVRPPETAGMTDAFRAMNRETFVSPPEAIAQRQRTKTAYLDAVREWGEHGRHALTPEEVRDRLSVPDAGVAEAHAHFRLGQLLLRDGERDEAAAELAEASRLHPSSWAMWRQAAQKNATGLAVGEDFWRRVDALGDRPYYAPAKL